MILTQLQTKKSTKIIQNFINFLVHIFVFSSENNSLINKPFYNVEALINIFESIQPK